MNPQVEPRAPTHRCKVCGARWILNPAEPDKYPPEHPFHRASWSLMYPDQCGKCCDNVAMGDQIEVLPAPSEGDK